MNAIIYLYVTHCLITFLLIYSSEEAKIWGNSISPTLRMPSIDDLKEEKTEYFFGKDSTDELETKIKKNTFIEYEHKSTRRNYIDKIILPASHYFSLKNTIENMQYSCANIITPALILFLFPIVGISKKIIEIELIPSYFVAYLTSTLFCLVSSCIILLLYKYLPLCRRFHINSFQYDKSSYNNCSNSNFNISDECHRNNLIIQEHFEYLNTIKETVSFRYYMRKICIPMCFIVYILFATIFFNI